MRTFASMSRGFISLFWLLALLAAGTARASDPVRPLMPGITDMRTKTSACLLLGQISVMHAYADVQVVGSSGDAYVNFEKSTGIWKLGTAAAEKTVQLSSEGKPEVLSLLDKGTGTNWNGSGNHLFASTAAGKSYTGASGYELVRHTTTTNRDGSLTLSIVLNKTEEK
jgi:hypothetical protein